MKKSNIVTHLITLIFLIPSISQADSEITANEIISKALEVYSGCSSYTDTGYSKTIFFNKGLETQQKILLFTTSFQRPNKFRFEYAVKDGDNLSDNYIIWMNGGIAKSYWEITGEENNRSLSEAIAAATGVSSATAHNIPILLMPELESCNRLLHNEDGKAQLLAIEKDQDGNLCYVIKIRSNEKIWINQDTFLVTRIEEYTLFDTFFTNEYTIYRPMANISIPEDNFEVRSNHLTKASSRQ